MHTPFRNLNPSLNTCGFHPGGNIDGIAPNVVIQLCRTNDSGSDITKVESDPENKNELKNEKKIKKKKTKLRISTDLGSLIGNFDYGWKFHSVEIWQFSWDSDFT